MRLPWLFIGAVLSVCLRGECQDAAMFRGNAQHSGVYPGTGVPKFSRMKWSFHTGGMVIASPAVVDGTVYIGSDDGNFYAVDAASAKEKWKLAVHSRVPSSAAVSNGMVYFGAYEGNFYAVDVASGKLKWKFKTGGERRFAGKHLHGVQPAAETMPDPFDCFLSSPVEWNGAVYFGSGDGNIYALSTESGALKWKFKTGDVVHASPAIADGKSSAAVADGMVYFGCRDSHLYAVDG